MESFFLGSNEYFFRKQGIFQGSIGYFFVPGFVLGSTGYFFSLLANSTCKVFFRVALSDMHNSRTRRSTPRGMVCYESGRFETMSACFSGTVDSKRNELSELDRAD